METNIADIIDKLCICNNKLFEICNLKANCDSMTREQLIELCHKDIYLCKERSSLKNEINRLLGFKTIAEVKSYGTT